VWQTVTASGLLRIGLGSTGSVRSVRLPFGSPVKSDSLQSNSGSTRFNFLFFSLTGSAHLAEEIFVYSKPL